MYYNFEQIFSQLEPVCIKNDRAKKIDCSIININN